MARSTGEEIRKHITVFPLGKVGARSCQGRISVPVCKPTIGIDAKANGAKEVAVQFLEWR